MGISIKVEGDFDSFEDELKSMVERFNKDLDKAGGKMTDQLKSFARRIEDFKSVADRERKQTIEKDYRYFSDRYSPEIGYNQLKKDEKNFKTTDRYESSLLSEIRDLTKQSVREEKDNARNEGTKTSTIMQQVASVLALRQVVSTGAQIYDRRANLSADTYGMSPAGNAVDAISNGFGVGIGIGGMIGGPGGAAVGAAAGALTAINSYKLAEINQKDARDLAYSKAIVDSANSTARYGLMGNRDELVNYTNNSYSATNFNTLKNAAVMGIGVSEYYQRLGTTAQQGGIQGGRAGISERAYYGAVFEKGYGINMDFSTQKLTEKSMLDVNIQMLNKLASIDKGGISATNTVLANQKLNEFKNILQAQYNITDTFNPAKAQQQMLAFQQLMPTASAEGVASLYGQVNSSVSRDMSGGLRVLQIQSMAQAMQKAGRSINDFGLIQREIDLGLSSDYSNDYVTNLTTNTLRQSGGRKGDEYLGMKMLHPGINIGYRDAMTNNPSFATFDKQGTPTFDKFTGVKLAKDLTSQEQASNAIAEYNSSLNSTVKITDLIQSNNNYMKNMNLMMPKLITALNTLNDNAHINKQFGL